MDNRNKIDDLFREALSGYRVEPSYGLYRRIERNFFPPSKFRPSGLITSILLLVVAGLMPWILIPANDQDELAPVFSYQPGTIRQGYLIEAAEDESVIQDGKNTVSISGRTFYIKPTAYLENNVVNDPNQEPALLASIHDPLEDPALQPILSAMRKEYLISPEIIGKNNSFVNDKWNYRMASLEPDLMLTDWFSVPFSVNKRKVTSSHFTPGYENDYVKKSEISAGLNFNPSIVFYDPNPYNKMIGADAIIRFKIASLSIMSGIGINRMEDAGSYKVNYVSNDSVGYYLRVVSFIPDPLVPDRVTYIVVREPIYDSVVHYDISDRTNYYTYIDIPLAFGYTFFQKNRMELTATVGVKFSVLIDKNEPTVDFWISEAELIDIERQVPARTGTNWRFTAGIDFGYNLTDKFSLHLEPIFEQYISPIYVDQPGYQPKNPYAAGIKAGFRYNF
jgi:hypothetical protein